MSWLTIAALLRKGGSAVKGWLLGGGWKVIALALAVLGGVYLLREIRQAREDRDIAKAAAAGAEAQLAAELRYQAMADKAVTGTLAAQAVIISKESKGRAQTEAALSANPDWAGEPVPTDVVSSLRE